MILRISNCIHHYISFVVNYYRTKIIIFLALTFVTRTLTKSERAPTQGKWISDETVWEWERKMPKW